MTAIFKRLLTAALFAVPVPVFAQSRATNFNDAVTACEREHRACIAVVEALAESNGRITAGQLRDIHCRAELFTAQDISQLPHCDTAGWNPPFEPSWAEYSRRAEADWAEFHRLFCDDSIYAEVADDRGGLSSEQVVEERALICAQENRP